MSKPDQFKSFSVDPRTATPLSLSQTSVDEMLLLAIAGGEDPTIAGGIEASARELELLYELCNSRGELWASGLLNQVQQRLRVLAELSRRRESRPPTPPVASA